VCLELVHRAPAVVLGSLLVQREGMTEGLVGEPKGDGRATLQFTGEPQQTQPFLLEQTHALQKRRHDTFLMSAGELPL
jgi:hypothetical protein